MKIAVASDHVGVELRHELAQEARALGYEILDLGPAEGEAADYPVYGELVGRAVSAGEADLGILVCGTGVGISLAANRVPGIRAVVCSEPFTAELSRRHNNSNVIAVGARVVGAGLARAIVRAWLTAEFEGGRHARRVDMLDAIR
ncbi:Ribose-5-phosphate isomerase B [Propionicimonas sp. T2.31MG-18]|uniref:ribose 5-phosphate isomerase B n=1 Tax=Propionicimonas sp. T2.31MG-18 TaxID=3157620 RepID=UPI0035E50D98